jgi:Spy/CpxP family protein refolding chaperone
MKKVVVALIFSTIPVSAIAQHSYGQGHGKPYEGQQERDIKALSQDEVKQYLAGGGMGFARPAELNRFPGPLHALELAERLELTQEQRSAIQALMDTHKAEARALGARLVAAERDLDRLFQEKNIRQEDLAKAVATASAMQGEYRLSHLETHRRLRPLLTDEQVARYDALRGYQ